MHVFLYFWSRRLSLTYGSGRRVDCDSLYITRSANLACNTRRFERGTTTYSVKVLYRFSASLIAFTSSSFTYPKRPSYPLCCSLCRTAASHFCVRVWSSRGRKPTHQPSKITALIFGSPPRLTTSHFDSGTRSPWPENADLSYCGMAVGALARKAANTFSPSGRSCVDG